MEVYNSCLRCKWYAMFKQCIAFPDKIPDKIWMGRNEHKKNVKGDHGYKFEPRKK